MSVQGHTRDHRDEPTYWFAVLEIARERDDFEGAAKAKRQLERLGVYVAFQRPKTCNRKGCPNG